MCETISIFFFFNDTATTEIYTLSLHDALPISGPLSTLAVAQAVMVTVELDFGAKIPSIATDRKSTRLNSSHVRISYAVFCLKKKKIMNDDLNPIRIHKFIDYFSIDY